MRYSHLSDDRLIEVWLDAAHDQSAQRHLDVCQSCAARHQTLVNLLADCTAVAETESDTAFGDERLQRQHARILQRIAHDGRPARVITFPAAHSAQAVPLRNRPTMRWIAGAAAAGLAIGLLAGELVEGLRTIDMRRSSQPIAAQTVRSATPAAVRTVSTTLSDDEFLQRMDSVVDRSGGGALGPLDQLTPRVWEVATP
jgi:hypothetical protein